MSGFLLFGIRNSGLPRVGGWHGRLFARCTPAAGVRATYHLLQPRAPIPPARSDRGVCAAGRLVLPSPLRTRPLHHLHQNLSGVCGITYFPQECNPSTTHSTRGFQPQVKAEAVDCCHRCFLRLNPSKCPSKQSEGIRVVGIHVSHDVGCGISQWIGLCAFVFSGRHLLMI